MPKYYRDEVLIKFNDKTDNWELILIETGEVLESARSIITLVNDNNCLK